MSETTTTFTTEDIGMIEESEKILPDIEELDLSNMNFAEMKATENSLKKSRDKATMTMDYIKQYREMQKPLSELKATLDELDDKKANLDDFDFEKYQKEMDLFEKDYTSMMERTEKIIEKLQKEMQERYGDQEKTSSFIVSQMNEVIEKKQNELTNKMNSLQSDSTKDHKFEIKKIEDKIICLNNMKNALNDRSDMCYWANRFSNKLVLKNTWKEVKKDYDKSMKKSLKYLTRYFTPKDIENVRNVLVLAHVFPGQQLAIACVFAELARCLRYEKESYKDWNARIFIMNILDYTQAVYDYHDEDKIWLPKFLASVLKNFQLIINSDNKGKYVENYLKSHKEEAFLDIQKITRFENYAKQIKENQNNS